MNLPPAPPSPPPRSLTRQPLPVRRRADLVVVETTHRNESAFVVKDPIAMKYHRLRPDEYFVLCHLDGKHSLDSIRDAYEQRYAPEKVKPAELNQLLFRFHQFGMTVSDAALQGEQLVANRNKQRRQRWMQHISGVLFIRFPGVDPEPILKRLYPMVRPAMGRSGMVVYALLVLLAGLLFLTNADRFAAELPTVDAWLNVHNVLLLAGVIGLTKILHELGHAVTCKHFGGECHQIGPMLLVFTPALYCDTSDSWMLPSRWARASVGMAGIAVEVGLASLATLAWWMSGDGIVHTIAMNVMIVCSVSTLLFNANPLLRYDGYYVLSDICDVPNLGERSRKLLAQTMGRFLWGINEPSAENFSPRESFWMLVYAAAAAVYRWTLTLAIIYLVMVMLRPYRLESIGRVLALFAAGSMAFMLLRPVYQFFSHPGRRRKIKMKRSLVSMLGFAALIAAAFVPLPSWVATEGRIVPRSEIPMYVASEGRLDSLEKQPGDDVQKGDVIARLSNPETTLGMISAKGRYETQKVKVIAIEADSMQNTDALSDLPGQRAFLAQLEKQYQRRKTQLDGLTITAPADGKLIAGPKFCAKPTKQDDVTLVTWTGHPTDSVNRHCWLSAGTELMALQSDLAHDAEVILDQLQVRRIKIGAEVKMIARDDPNRILRGRVVEVAMSDFDPAQHGSRRDDPQASQSQASPATEYLVRIELDESTTLKPDVRVEGTITSPPRSAAAKIYEMVTSLFRIR